MDDSLQGFFTNEEYDEKEVRIGDFVLHLRGLTAASTDYDLTGQVLWPGARLLAAHIAANTGLLHSRASCVEIGAGLGLVGLVAAKFCDTVLTDHNEFVLRVLRENASKNASNHTVRCMSMDWERVDEVQNICSCSPNGKGYDLVLGADICYGLKALPYIFGAYAMLLAPGKSSLGLLGYVSRALAIDRGILIHAAEAGLTISEVHGSERSLGGGLLGRVYKLQR